MLLSKVKMKIAIVIHKRKLIGYIIDMEHSQSNQTNILSSGEPHYTVAELRFLEVGFKPNMKTNEGSVYIPESLLNLPLLRNQDSHHRALSRLTF